MIVGWWDVFIMLARNCWDMNSFMYNDEDCGYKVPSQWDSYQ